VERVGRRRPAGVVVDVDGRLERAAAVGGPREAQVARGEAAAGDDRVVLPDDIDVVLRAHDDLGRRLVVRCGIVTQIVHAHGLTHQTGGITVREVDVRDTVAHLDPHQVLGAAHRVDGSGRIARADGGEGERLARHEGRRGRRAGQGGEQSAREDAAHACHR
jgi:hypothetical protein